MTREHRLRLQNGCVFTAIEDVLTVMWLMYFAAIYVPTFWPMYHRIQYPLTRARNSEYLPGVI
jgi:hypothetical protein